LIPGAPDDLSEQTFTPKKGIFYEYIILYDYNRQMLAHAPTDVVSHDKCRLTRQMSSHTRTDNVSQSRLTHKYFFVHMTGVVSPTEKCRRPTNIVSRTDRCRLTRKISSHAQTDVVSHTN